MNYHIKHIGLIVLAMIFVFSTSGIHLTLHHCHDTGHYSLHLMNQHPECDHNKHYHDKEENRKDQQTCPSNKINFKCCSNKHQYFAIENNFIHTPHHTELTPSVVDLFEDISIQSIQTNISQQYHAKQKHLPYHFLSLHINKKYSCLLI